MCDRSGGGEGANVGGRELAVSSGHPSLWELLRTWALIGVQSFGGGTATLYLIQRAVVEQRSWISEEEFVHAWALCQAAPGINILGLTILIGRRLGGAPAIAASLLGLLLPSVSATIALTAVYASVRDLSLVQQALRGVVPATVGLGGMLAWQMGRPLLRTSWREGRAYLAASCGLLVASALCYGILHAPVIAILVASGAIGALLQLRGAREAS